MLHFHCLDLEKHTQIWIYDLPVPYTKAEKEKDPVAAKGRDLTIAHALLGSINPSLCIEDIKICRRLNFQKHDRSPLLIGFYTESSNRTSGENCAS